MRARILTASLLEMVFELMILAYHHEKEPKTFGSRDDRFVVVGYHQFIFLNLVGLAVLAPVDQHA